ncbi:molybdopterin-dependent oxidoreductase [Conexibacter sp. SYSU D00693]|uniref:molybdopterin-dependent oxidoreductase n=1 Tax=Conexibacter sp. SYSU D00693 TaxID=2812560 RepID=UPI00196AD407|nr:molybdopterin-dependent oxidoreductase [Conexibacter sp. SYSU D00693]
MRRLPQEPPPGPSDPTSWVSPLRGPWLTSALGALLLAGVVVVAGTGFLSHLAYAPDLGRNAIVPRHGHLDWLLVDWPASWPWTYAVTQGLHVTVGFAVIPLLLAKLWSVIPRLFEWPPVRGPLHALERLTLLLLVGGAIFQFATGVFNAQLSYPFHFNFVVAHFYGAWIFVAALVLHVAAKVPTMRRAFRERGVLQPLIDDLRADGANVEPHTPGSLAPPVPEPPSLTRRGLFGLVGASSAALVVTTAGQSVGGPLRELAVLAPRGGDLGFPVNKTAAAARVTPEMVGAGWRLQLAGGARALSRADLLAMELREHDLPIACVEGWSSTQRWTGVRLADLAALVDAPEDAYAQVTSLQPAGVLRQAALTPGQVRADQALLALRVNGRDLSLDHGYPARIVVPGLPGVHCTKWVSAIDFHRA